jgi:nucleoside phosphorylase
VTVGSTIVAAGERGSDGSLTATTVTIVPARVIGTVSAVNGDTLTVSRRDGTTMTVHVSSATTIVVAGVTKATISDVKPGMVVVVEGTQRSDGSLDASAVRGGQPGKVRDHAGDGPKTVPSPSSGAPGATG